MLEVIPNWHPLVVHFPIALVIASMLCFVGAGISSILPQSKEPLEHRRTSRTTRELFGASKWGIWLGAVSAAAAVLTGWLAESSVVHEKSAHEVIETHEMWGFLTAETLVLFAIVSIAFRKQWGKKAYKTTLIALVILSIFVSITGWYGTKIVYQYGTGVRGYTPGINYEHDHARDSAADTHLHPHKHSSPHPFEHDHPHGHPHHEPDLSKDGEVVPEEYGLENVSSMSL
tara:strand:- start:2572 stop:3261 length:690 start_codon:yes stop_codon:yes gene_type:complete